MFNGREVYADNAATTRVSEAALEAMTPYFREEWGNPSSVHPAGQRAARAMISARETIARLLGCSPRELYITSGGSEADCQAILTAAEEGRRIGKMHIISTAFEHHAVLHALQNLKDQGFRITLLAPSHGGYITPEQVEAAISEDTALVSVMYANNEVGTVQPIEEIGRLCWARQIWFHSDAVQAAGHLPLSVEKTGVDLMSLSAHKFHGPKGIGLLYARRGIVPARLIFGGGQERGRRAGTENVAAVVGMAAALEERCRRMDQDRQRTEALRDRLEAGLLQIPGAVRNGGPDGAPKPGSEEPAGCIPAVGAAVERRDAAKTGGAMWNGSAEGGAMYGVPSAGSGTAAADGAGNTGAAGPNGDGRMLRLPGTLNMAFEGVGGEALLMMLAERGICASAGAACMAGSLEPSHVLLSMGRTPEEAAGAVRFSLSEENTPDEVDYIVETVRWAVDILRSNRNERGETRRK